MLAVQECYISVCKEKDMLEECIRNREKEETLIRQNEVFKIQLYMVLTLVNHEYNLKDQKTLLKGISSFYYF